MYRRERWVIIEYLEDIGEVQSTFNKGFFDKKSYSRWAATEILDIVETNPTIDPYILVSKFLEDMLIISKNTNYYSENKKIWMYACDVAIDILDVFRAMR